jgi:hypothetical protein
MGGFSREGDTGKKKTAREVGKENPPLERKS